MQFLREKLAFVQCLGVLTNRGERLGKDWKKKGRPKLSYHLDKINNILLDIERKRVRLLYPIRALAMNIHITPIT